MPFLNTNGEMVDANKMMNRIAIGDTNPVTGGSWLANPEKVSAISTLRNNAMGNCKLLYGSDRFKYYDIIICENEDDGKFGALLTCTESSAIKILRNEVADCPVVAVRQMVQRLQRDTALLFVSKYTVGSQIRGQQGYTNKDTGAFELIPTKQDQRIVGPDDDTAGLTSRYSDAPGAIPWAPRAERAGGYKRMRGEGRNGGLDYGEDS
ncbi:hypothetical protein T440DRAFT_452727 [Plenodomus tracheiphilus IPT5]|uniref:Uncharacterized protein n=1 Tax=Plenodomus tracheiphilus IPT5 TaxID=1408161 RepID=A0A6A7B4G4_9PLEO|nr:hypothetical protein T440DRAFT_452727 [Plenodomus tracheiphilus IPT5]